MWGNSRRRAVLLMVVVHAAAATPFKRDWPGVESTPDVTGGWRRVVQLVHDCRVTATTAAALEENLEGGDDVTNDIDGNDTEESGGGGSLSRLQRCLVNATLTSLRDVLRQERVLIAPGIELVRHNNSAGDESTWVEESEQIENGGLGKALSLLRSYSLIVGNPNREVSEGRLRRHQYKHMFPLMVMSFMAITAFLVPMGFQFMAVLGGKALLLSKMALMAASMLTYKKLATDFSHHSHGHGHGHSYHDPYYYGFHDRAANVHVTTSAPSSWF